MHEIVCPNCKKVFKADEAGFADVIKQVRDHQFDEELQKQLKLVENAKANEAKLNEANFKNQLQAELAKKDALINDFEAPIFKAYPELQTIKETLYQNGAVYAAMTGTGSTVYGIFPSSIIDESSFNFPSNYFVHIQ